jgi:threonine/homoserine/homoserine lactone efflux protein
MAQRIQAEALDHQRAGGRNGHDLRRRDRGGDAALIGDGMIPVPDPTSLGLFVVAALVLLLTPGPAVLYIVTRSIDQGRRAGLVSMLGVHVGTLVHVAAAAAGLSALLAASALAFTTVKYLGAAYLVYLGVRRLLERGPAPGAGAIREQRLRRAFLDGVVVNVLNPKTALFFLAFLPQFVDVSRGHVGAQILLLGGLFVSLGLVTDGSFALTAGTAAQWLRGHPRFVAGERWMSGGMYIGLGVAAALTSSQQRR